MEVVVHGVEVAQKKGEEELFCVLGDNVSTNIDNAILLCKTYSSINDIVEEHIMQVERFNACVATALTYLRPRENCEARIDNGYTDTFTFHVSKVVNQPIEQVDEFVQIWEPRDLELQFEITEMYL